MEHMNKHYHTIMLIDDSDIDNMVNKHILTKSRLCDQILIYSGACDALNYLQEAYTAKDRKKNPIPDLVLLDINMPIMNGFDFLEAFSKFDPELIKLIKIIMLTSSVDPNDIKRSEENPFVSGFISKPLSIEQLLKI